MAQNKISRHLSNVLFDLPRLWIVTKTATGSVLSLVWERLWCPLWHHRGMVSRTTHFSTPNFFKSNRDKLEANSGVRWPAKKKCYRTFQANLLFLITLFFLPFLLCLSSLPHPSSSASIPPPPPPPPGPSWCLSENKTFNYVASSLCKLHQNTHVHPGIHRPGNFWCETRRAW